MKMYMDQNSLRGYRFFITNFERLPLAFYRTQITRMTQIFTDQPALNNIRVNPPKGRACHLCYPCSINFKYLFKKLFPIKSYIFTVALFLVLSASAQEKGIFNRIWETPRLYENEENPAIQSFSIIGRYQGQYWSVNAGDESASDWENRRFFVGAEARLFRQFVVHGQMVISEDFDPFYNGLYQAFVKWSPGEFFSMSVGRLDFLFIGLERTVSSLRIVTFERGLLVNQIMPGEVVAALAEGKPGGFSYRAGVFSGSIEREFTSFEGGVGAVAGVGYDLPLFYESGSVHLDYLFNDGNPANNALRPYDHIISLWHQGQKGRFGLGVDLTWADGLDARPPVFGVTALPTYDFLKELIRKGDRLQAVLRYQFSASEGDNGLQLQNRYEREVATGQFGDRYQAGYAGINYLVFGDRFKFMAGAEYSDMDDSANDGGDFAGWTFLAGMRGFF